MIYILTLLVIFICVVNFDLLGHTNKKDVVYKIILVWFIAVSGFAFNVGADIPGYMYEYDEYSWARISSWDDLMEFRHRQPGWVIVNLICHAVSGNFFFFKLVEAIFVNAVIFRFIKKYCPYIFTGILLYAVMLYLNLNFNTLRQAYSLAFFLIGFDYLVEREWIKYCIFAILAFMFHSSAIIFLIFPIFHLIRLNTTSILVILALVLTVFLGAGNFFIDNMQSLFFDLAISNGDLAVEYGDIGNKFLNYDNQELNIIGYIELILRLVIGGVAVLYNSRYRKEMPQLIGVLTIVFLVFRLFDTFIPVLFFRLMFYVQLFYIVSLATFCIDVSKKFVSKKAVLVPLLLVVMFCYTPIKALFKENPRAGITDLEQFYPYYSVFNPHTYPPRSSTFGWHK